MKCNDLSQSRASLWKFTLAWAVLLGRLSALGGGARVLAATLDSLAGGKPNRWLFGGPTLPAGTEPWPDPLAVAALALLCMMLMCGLEVGEEYNKNLEKKSILMCLLEFDGVDRGAFDFGNIRGDFLRGRRKHRSGSSQLGRTEFLSERTERSKYIINYNPIT
jgi:hypothetical protein